MKPSRNVLVHLQVPEGTELTVPKNPADFSERGSQAGKQEFGDIPAGKFITAGEIIARVRESMGKKASKTVATQAVNVVMGTIASNLQKQKTMHLGNVGTFRATAVKKKTTVDWDIGGIPLSAAPMKIHFRATGGLLPIQGDYDIDVSTFFKKKSPKAVDAKAVKAAVRQILLGLSEGQSIKLGPVPGTEPHELKTSPKELWMDLVFTGASETSVGQIKAPDESVRPPKIRIGVWDLGAWLGKLSPLLEKLTDAQDRYEFYVVESPVPVGMIRSREAVQPWLVEVLGRKLTQDDDPDSINDNMVAGDFFGLAEPVRKNLGIDYLLGVTPSMIAEEEEHNVVWNHYSTFHERLILASTFDLRTYAKETKRSFDVFLATLIIAQTLVAQFYHRGLGFHSDTGCLFDYNQDRVSLKKKIGEPCIEPSCLKLIPPEFHTAAQAFVDCLKTLP